MTERSYPFGSSAIVTEDDYSMVMRFAAIDGVCGSPADAALLPVANGTGTITAAGGEAFVRGQKYILTGSKSFTVPVNSGGTPRLDYIALANDPTADAITMVYVTGGTSLPTLTRAFGSTWSIPVAAVTVAAGASVVGPSACMDARWFSGVPVVPSLPGARRPVGYGQLLVEGGKDVYVGDGTAYNYLGSAGNPAWSAYTPVWTSDTTVNWGAGAVNVGRFKLKGKTCNIGIELQPAVAIALSNVRLTVSLPYPARSGKRQLLTLLIQGPAAMNSGVAIIESGASVIGYLEAHTTHSSPATLTPAQQGSPITLTGTGSAPNGAYVNIDGTYEIA